MSNQEHAEIAVLGAGLAGIATAYYLCKANASASVVLVDCRPPMSFTSAQSGDNYRNWWPHPTMTAFTNYSIDLMEEVARASSNRFNMTRRGYLLASRQSEVDAIISGLDLGYAESRSDSTRFHTADESRSYDLSYSGWETAPRGVDVLADQKLIRASFPSLHHDVQNVIHVRRAGDISGQQLGQYMLEELKSSACKRRNATVIDIDHDSNFTIELNESGTRKSLTADIVVNAAGPFAAELAAMLDVKLPISNIYHQKIAFEDKLGAIPRDLPFSCDLDDVFFDWSGEEIELLREDPDTAWLTENLPGGVHCRPEGGDMAKWIKIGWAYNEQASKPQQDLENEPCKNDQFPEIAMRAAARLNPSLQHYVDEFPSKFIHYGGYYPMTAENWPLIGPLGVPGAFIAGALSGFGSMSACAAGSLCAAWVTDGELPSYASQLSLQRYDDQELMRELTSAQSLGIL